MFYKSLQCKNFLKWKCKSQRCFSAAIICIKFVKSLLKKKRYFIHIGYRIAHFYASFQGTKTLRRTDVLKLKCDYQMTDVTWGFELADRRKLDVYNKTQILVYWITRKHALNHDSHNIPYMTYSNSYNITYLTHLN